MTPAEIEAMVRGASIIELVDVMLVRTDYEDRLLAGFRGEHGADHFPCPRCQFTKGRWSWFEWYAATVEDSVFWRCGKCFCRGTRWEIIDHVLRDPAALSSFLAGVTCGAS